LQVCHQAAEAVAAVAVRAAKLAHIVEARRHAARASRHRIERHRVLGVVVVAADVVVVVDTSSAHSTVSQRTAAAVTALRVPQQLASRGAQQTHGRAQLLKRRAAVDTVVERQCEHLATHVGERRERLYDALNTHDAHREVVALLQRADELGKRRALLAHGAVLLVSRRALTLHHAQRSETRILVVDTRRCDTGTLRQRVGKLGVLAAHTRVSTAQHTRVTRVTQHAYQKPHSLHRNASRCS
jgi:hypothetical protein